LGLESALASVSVDDVRDVVNVSSAEFPDAKVLKMVKRGSQLETVKFQIFEVSSSIIFRKENRI